MEGPQPICKNELAMQNLFKHARKSVEWIQSIIVPSLS